MCLGLKAYGEILRALRVNILGLSDPKPFEPQLGEFGPLRKSLLGFLYKITVGPILASSFLKVFAKRDSCFNFIRLVSDSLSNDIFTFSSTSSMSN